MRRTYLMLSVVAALAACTQETAPPPAASENQTPVAEGSPPDATLVGPQAVEGQIDWAAARAARAASPVTDTPISVQSVTGTQTPPKVPVLLPSGIVQAQNARPPALVSTADGYFATYQLPRYDAIVNGSQKSYSADAPPAGDKEAMKFTQAEAGAQLAFSRFGADYLIEFECRQLDGSATCISEDEAKAFAESLFVQQTQ